MKRILTIIICIVIAAIAISCGNGDSNSQEQTSTDSGTNGKVILEIQGEDSSQTYQMSLADIKKIGTTIIQYSARSKEANNKRTIEKYTGVELSKLFAKAGFQDVKVFKVICSDGYTKEYEMDQLNDLYTFKNDTDTTGKKVKPMLAIVKNEELSSKDDSFDSADGTPLRLVFGQESYDSKETKDFNMQGWASFVETIVVEE